MALKLPIFMDYHSTTPVDPRVLEEMLPVLHDEVRQRREPQPRLRLEGGGGGGARARAHREAHRRARTRRRSSSRRGATESDNLAIKGVAEFYKDKGNHIITTVTEHKAVLDTCKRLEKEGFEVTYLGVGKDGLVDPDDVKKAITDKTILVSVMLANNEIGTVQPLEAIGKITRERGVLLHSDAVQGVGKVDFDVAEDERRPRVAHRPQDVRAQGRRRALRAAQQAARAPRRADGRRRARARDALGHAERAAHRRLRQGRARSCTREGKAESARLARPARAPPRRAS